MGAELVGRSVAKKFPGHGNKKFRGNVTAYDPEDVQAYHIKYEDGDEEDITEQDLMMILLPEKVGGKAKASSSGSAKEAKPSEKAAEPAAKASTKEVATKKRGASKGSIKAAGKKRKGADAEAAVGEDAAVDKAAPAAEQEEAAPAAEEAVTATEEEKEEKKFTAESKQPCKAGGAKKKKKDAAAAAATAPVAATEGAGDMAAPAVSEGEGLAEAAAALAEAAAAAAGGGEGEAGPSTRPAAVDGKAFAPTSDLTAQAVAGSEDLQGLIAEVAARSKAQALNVVRYGGHRPSTSAEEAPGLPLQSLAVTCGDVCYVSTIFPKEVKRVHVDPEPPQEEVEAEYANQAEQVLAELERQLEAAGTSKEHLIFVNVMLREIDKGTPPFRRVWNTWVAALPAMCVMESFMDNECLVAVTAQAAVPPATF